jgi:NTP pyrophosphatase (non-canonical NTP hydrolase)
MHESFEEMVAALVKPGDEIARNITPEQAHLIHMAAGIAGEAGELLDAIKKHVIYNKALDLPHIVEELGDIEFYLEGLRQKLEIQREYVLLQNQKKLSGKGGRYESGYSDEAAQARADKA